MPVHYPPATGASVWPRDTHALLLAWKAAKYICAKRLIPFLPTLVPALERHGYLQLTEESRSMVLQVSPTTADRLLHSHRTSIPRTFSLTQSGPLLKHQIPIRTFQQWNETQPGFVEADLVAHCGGHPEGSFLYTFTLTDVATGWTECLPLLSKSAEAVLFAFEQARTLFPFPILGLDVDNGGEFINEHLMRYCDAQQITFTRGRPDLKADQCYVEQKNRAIVRTMVAQADRAMTHLRKTAMPEARVEAALRNALESEAELTESDGADERLLALLGLRGTPKTHQSKVKTDEPSPSPKDHSRPGKRSPGRDATGQEEQPGSTLSDEEQAAG